MFLIVGCGTEQPSAAGGSEEMKNVVNKSSLSKSNPGIEGCSHSFRSLPDVYKSTADNPASVTFSSIKSGVNLDAVDKVIGIDKSNGRGILPVVTTIYTKDDAAVERVGTFSYFCKDGDCRGDDLGVAVEVDKEDFIETFGSYPKVDCRVIGMNGPEPDGPVQQKYSPAIEGCSHKFDYLPDSLNPNSIISCLNQIVSLAHSARAIYSAWAVLTATCGCNLDVQTIGIQVTQNRDGRHVDVVIVFVNQVHKGKEIIRIFF